MQHETSLQEHLNQFNILVGQLAMVEVMIKDEDMRKQLYCSIIDAQFMGSLIMNFKNVPTLSMDFMVLLLLIKELG